MFTSGILLPEKYVLLVATYFNYKVIVYVFELAYILIVKKSLNVKNYKLGSKTMPTVKSAVHLGIIRTTSLTENMTINVEENIKKVRRSAYGLLGGGYHGNNGLDPDTLIHLLKT